MGFISRGFRGKRRDTASSSRLPPGQYVVTDYPVLSAGPTPRIPLSEWTFVLEGEIDQPKKWTWEEFRKLPTEQVTKDIHCVTKWSKFDTVWTGVSIDTILDGVETAAEYTVQFSYGGYTTNLIPHLYFWKSAKWIRGIRLVNEDQPGFWEVNGYNNYGDPWREQRYWGD
ncbi:MAG: sulfite oxidase-like oxidoreductase [Chloroflexi bacterium]|nr:MAG: sulfite oxidase-like oxidoreductase [Chloroflexota bacterium]